MSGRILVTGGAGFIGRHLVARLVEAGKPVRVLSRSARRRSDGAVEYLPGDFSVARDAETALDGVEVVYHLATTTTPGSANARILEDARINLLGSLGLISAAAEAGIRRFLFVSSGGSVYGPGPRRAAGEAPAHSRPLREDDAPEAQPRPLREDDATEPIAAHGVAKLAIEKYLHVFHAAAGMECRVARGANPFGEGQDPGRGQGFVPYALRQLARNEPVTIWGDGSVVRDFFYVGDFVEALFLLLDDGGPHEVYNVGGGRGRSLLEMLSILESVTGRRAVVRLEPGRPVDVPYNCLDISRIREALRWEPKVPVEEGVARTWAWVSAAPTGRRRPLHRPQH